MTRAPQAAPLLGLMVFALLGPARPASAQAHSYDLTQSYADADGGPSLTPNGGTRDATGYSFAANQGPTLSGALTGLSDYSLDFTFSLSDINGYKKLIDFKGLTSDNGLYNLNGVLDFYPIASGPVVFAVGQTAEVLITRNGLTDVFTASVNGIQQFQFTDTTGQAIFSSNAIRFFQDDTATGMNESGPGLLKTVSLTSSPAPEPSPFAVLGVGSVGLGVLRLRARRRG